MSRLEKRYAFQSIVFSEGNIKQAARTVQSYLLFFPDDVAMLSNRDFYLEDLRADAAWFAARPEAAAYAEREAREAKFVELVEEGFGRHDDGGVGAVASDTTVEVDEGAVIADNGVRIPEPVPPPVVKLEL